MVQDIVIRAEFLIEDLRKSILIGDDFHPNIINAWKEDIRFIIQNGIECVDEQIYDLYNKEDLKECIDEGTLRVLNQLVNDSSNNYSVEQLAEKFGYSVEEILNANNLREN